MILSCRLVATHVLKVAPREEFSMAKPQFAKASPHKVHSHPPITAIRSASLSSLRQPHAEECRYGQRNSDFHAVRRERSAGINKNFWEATQSMGWPAVFLIFPEPPLLAANSFSDQCHTHFAKRTPNIWYKQCLQCLLVFFFLSSLPLFLYRARSFWPHRSVISQNASCSLTT